jgi:protein-S-isoprenylcysteine O-methyltransferase Ste14
MQLIRRIERQGQFLFRWRSFLPLVLVPLAIIALSQGYLVTGTLSEYWEHVWLGLCMAISFLGLGIRCVTIGFVAAGTSGRNTKSQKANTLNTTGLYSLMRHPLYVGNFIVLLGLAMSPMEWWLVAIVCLAYWIYVERVSAAEEAYLAEKFGSAFTEWAARTPAFFPRFDGWQPPKLSFSLRKVLRGEYHAFFLIVSTFFLVELVSDVGFQGEPIGQWLTDDWDWLLVFLVGATAFFVLGAIKKRTGLLRVEGR